MFSFIKNHKLLLSFLTLILVVSLGGGVFLYLNKGQVVSEKRIAEIVGYPSPSPSPIPSPSPSPDPEKPYKGKYVRIAVYGDSMVETMGEYMDYLKSALEAKYPGADFVLLNYGIGAQNAQMGLDRWDAPFDRNERHFLPISRVEADIIIMGSFAYNPFTPHDKAKHMALLTELVNKAKGASPKVYLLAEIAPLQDGFGDGPNGVNWEEVTSDEHTVKIKENLENAVFLSKTLSVGLINAYTASQTSSGYGKVSYVNPSDGIHPSVEGHIFMATMIANTIKID